MLRYDTFQKANKKTLISLHGCADWSAPLLFPNPEIFWRRGPIKVFNGPYTLKAVLAYFFLSVTKNATRFQHLGQ